MKKYKLLDLFCGAGGATKGYQRAGFYVVGVDIKPQPHYCGDEFHQADALDFPLEGFDAYHASPPCQAYMDCNSHGLKPTKHPRLIEPIRELFLKTGKPFVIENVHKAPLKARLMLCGTMFGLRVIRHRYFEASFPLPLSPFTCNHWGSVARGVFIAVYGRGGKGPRTPKGRIPYPLNPQCSKHEAMGIDWDMTDKEINDAIPPAYTEYIGKHLMQYMESSQLRGR
jgi:hypothetical protein